MSVDIVTARGKALLYVERVAWTFAQQFIVVLLAADTGSLYHLQAWLPALDSAAFAAVIAAITSLVTTLTPLVSRLTGWADLGARTTLTFVQSVLGSLLASVAAPSVLHAPWQGAFAVAIPVTFLALLKGTLALLQTHSFSASTVPQSAVVRV